MKDVIVELIFVPYEPPEITDDVIFFRDNQITTVNGGLLPMNWKPVQPYLISTDNVREPGDTFACMYKQNPDGSTFIEIHNDIGMANNCCKKIMATPEQIGLIYTDENLKKPCELATYYKKVGIEDLRKIISNNNLCAIDADMYCPNYKGSHKGKDCSCKTGFAHTPKLLSGKVIIHLEY